MSGVHEDNAQVRQLLDTIYRQYGYDFRHYALASLKRRVHRRMAVAHLDTVAELETRIREYRAAFAELLFDFSIDVTEMFRDPAFFLTLRREVVPILRTFPMLKIWHAGCATGEEVYSLAVVLHEEGLYARTRIYATDFNDKALSQAKEGVFPVSRIREASEAYQKSGGAGSLADHYSAAYGNVIMNRELKKNILFTNHNLATDSVFGEMNLVICRNVLIYFDRVLQNRAIGLFHDSLCNGGFLGLGSKETLAFSDFADAFRELGRNTRIYKKTPANRL